jgi:hypothetical protein
MDTKAFEALLNSRKPELTVIVRELTASQAIQLAERLESECKIIDNQLADADEVERKRGWYNRAEYAQQKKYDLITRLRRFADNPKSEDNVFVYPAARKCYYLLENLYEIVENLLDRAEAGEPVKLNKLEDEQMSDADRYLDINEPAVIEGKGE